MCFRTSRSSVHAPWPVSGNSHCQLWTHHARQLLAAVRHCRRIHAKPIQGLPTYRVAVFQVFWGCSVEGAKTSAASSRSHQLQCWKWRVSVSSLWMFEQYCDPSPTTHRDTRPQVRSLTLGITERHVTKPNDTSLTLCCIFTKCQSSQLGGVAESDQWTDSSTSFFPQDVVRWSVLVIFFSL